MGGGVRRGAVLHLRAVGGGRRLAARRRWLPRRLALRARLRQKVVAVGRRAAVGEERAHGGGAAAAVAVVGEVVDSEAAVGAVEAARAEDRLVLGVAWLGLGLGPCPGRGLWRRVGGWGGGGLGRAWGGAVHYQVRVSIQGVVSVHGGQGRPRTGVGREEPRRQLCRPRARTERVVLV